MKKGVTLIALIITIIVLLILAGVSIALMIGDNGILTKAQEAKIKTYTAQLEERILEWKLNREIEKNTNQEMSKSLPELLDELQEEGLLTDEEREEIEETGTVTKDGKPIEVVGENELAENGITQRYILRITTSAGVTTKYETVPDAVAALQDGDLLETIGTLQYDGETILIEKNITLSGKINFTNNDSGIRIKNKTLTLQNLTIEGISNFPVMASTKTSKIFVGENSNVSIVGIHFAVGLDAGDIEIHSGTYQGNEAIYCGGSQSGGHFVTNITGSNTHLIGTTGIFHAFSNANLTVTPEVDVQRPTTGFDIIYQGGGAKFNVPSTYTINNVTGGSFTRTDT